MHAEETLARLAQTGTPPDGADIAHISAGLEEALGRIVDETFPFVAASGGELQFVHAPYGRGKTHFLRAVEHRARDHGFVTAFVDCQDGDSPFMSLPQTYRAIARSMMPPRRQSFFGSSGVAKVIEAQFAGSRTDEQRTLIDRIATNSALAPDYRNLVRSYSGFITGDEVEQFGYDIEALLAGEIGYRVTLGALYRTHPRVLRPLGKLGPRNAGLWLRSLLALPRILGYPGLVVMFDETEAVLNRGGARQKQRRLAHIRTFVDHLAVGSFRGCAVYYAVVEDFIEQAGQHLGALAQRIERCPVPGTRNPRAVSVNLDELTEPGPRHPRFFKQLAERIVDLGRAAGLPSDAGRQVLEQLTRDAAQFAEDLAEGKVREFVKKAAGTVAQEVMRHEA